MSRFLTPIMAGIILLAGTLQASAEGNAASVTDELTWHDNYADGVRQAEVLGKFLLIHFYDPGAPSVNETFEQKSLGAEKVRKLLARYVRVRLPLDAKTTSGGEKIELLKHKSFAEMLGRPGIAIIDYMHAGADYFGHVVSTFPFSEGHYYGPERMQVVLDLPEGTLTQRTMIYAVRIHPEAPKSTEGDLHHVLANEAQSHSQHQAAIHNQGHHRWDSRFYRINARLNGSGAQEVVAESWPGENLVEACVECVNSWRQSPGHWSAVRGRHLSFGYDIKRGSNGIWYATGLFANVRNRR